MKKIITKGLNGAEFADRLQEYREDVISLLDFTENDYMNLFAVNEETFIKILNKLIVNIEDETEGAATIEDAAYILHDEYANMEREREKNQ